MSINTVSPEVSAVVSNNAAAEVPVEDCFIDLLSKMFAANGVANPTAWEARLPKAARTAAGTDPYLCQFMVNSFWRHELGLAAALSGHPTSDARYSIVDAKTDPALLIRLYKENVLPWIIKLNLPTTA